MGTTERACPPESPLSAALRWSPFVDGVRAVADYRFRVIWEAYRATLWDSVPNTVAEFPGITGQRLPH